MGKTELTENDISIVLCFDNDRHKSDQLYALSCTGLGQRESLLVYA